MAFITIDTSHLDKHFTPDAQAQILKYQLAYPNDEPRGRLKDYIWVHGLTWLGARTSSHRDKYRSQVGQWIKKYGEHEVASAFLAAQKFNPADPVPWMIRRLDVSHDMPPPEFVSNHDGIKYGGVNDVPFAESYIDYGHP